MMKKTISVLLGFLLVTILFSMVSVNADSSNTENTFFAGGEGTIEDPYQIRNWRHLNNIQHYPDKNFTLMNSLFNNTEGYDVYASISANAGDGWKPIQSRWDEPFTGTFDGQNYTINDLFINRSRFDYIGLFSTLQGARISNIGVVDVNITGLYHVGGLVGVMIDSSVSNSYVTGTIKGEDFVGGLIGNMRDSSIVTNCYSFSAVSGNLTLGGLIGGMYGSLVSDSYASGITAGVSFLGGLIGGAYSSSIIHNSFSTSIVKGYSFWIGGLIGSLETSSMVNSSYATGNVTGTSSYVGGLIGRVTGYSSVNNSYATGEITANDEVGGLIGRLSSSKIYNSYAMGKVTGDRSVGGLVGFALGSTVVNNSYATGNVMGESSVGGFVGLVWTGALVTRSYSIGNVICSHMEGGGFVGNAWNGSIISNSYSHGSVTRLNGTLTIFGGFVGRNYQGKILNCFSTGRVHYQGATDPINRGFCGNINTSGTYEMSGNFWDISTSGQSSTSGDAAGMTASQMKTSSTFSDAGWDIALYDTWDGETWFIDEGNDYPGLGWQYSSFERIDDNDNGTPGFEILLLITAVLIFVFYRKSKKNLNKNK
jgi:hypothetical protein